MIDSLDAFKAFARKIADLNGISLDLAYRYASLIGDTPELDDAGLVVVRDRDGSIVARLRF